MFLDLGVLTPGRELPTLCESGPPGELRRLPRRDGGGGLCATWVRESRSDPRKVIGFWELGK